MENVCQNTLNCTIHKKSGEYAPIPLNKVRSNTLSIIFYMKNENFYNFFWTKYSSKRTKLYHFLKFSRGSMPPNPPNKCVASPHAAWRKSLVLIAI